MVFALLEAPQVRLLLLEKISRISMDRDLSKRRVVLDFHDASGDECRMTISLQTMEDLVDLHYKLKQNDNNNVILPGQLSIEDVL